MHLFGQYPTRHPFVRGAIEVHLSAKSNPSWVPGGPGPPSPPPEASRHIHGWTSYFAPAVYQINL
ncbi:hypothetical protein N7537_001152 [Penicillium hordei]|uniref:Uncharacterized protein n=1 Tax=Penicillium hordei TaxID=40994 RepID=A0AAD6EF06_9EURO|nr:uncharacterized protein N7537_001152 [Penicillium hordei]KAJ5616038.1 hypothetical protein N7537_001152 [Penicillium hordei]